MPVRVERVLLRNYRNYQEVDVSLPAGLVLVVGANAAGKTNLVEAIALACSGRSPRGARDGDLARTGSGMFRIELTVSLRTGSTRLQVIYARDSGRRIHHDGRPVRRRADLMGRFPLVTFFPDDLRLVKGGPAGRRRFLDLLVCQLEPRHYADLQEFLRVLEQRNTLLRDARHGRTGRSTAGLFDEQALRLATAVTSRRLRVLEQLEREACTVQKQLGGESLSIRYLINGTDAWEGEGQDVACRLEGMLRQLRPQEMTRGYTLWGPHRDDLLVLLNGMDARSHGSQGQQRTAVLALKRAEIQLLAAALSEPPVVVMDDVLSELDERRAAALGDALAGVEQTVVTAAVVPQTLWTRPARAVLHVRDGQITTGEADQIGRPGSF